MYTNLSFKFSKRSCSPVHIQIMAKRLVLTGCASVLLMMALLVDVARSAELGDAKSGGKDASYGPVQQQQQNDKHQDAVMADVRALRLIQALSGGEKRNMEKYAFGLGKRAGGASLSRPSYSFGLGKRSKALVGPYSFGLGKRPAG